MYCVILQGRFLAPLTTQSPGINVLGRRWVFIVFQFLVVSSLIYSFVLSLLKIFIFIFIFILLHGLSLKLQGNGSMHQMCEAGSYRISYFENPSVLKVSHMMSNLTQVSWMCTVTKAQCMG